ncbi:Hypothetical predicted protein [Paramuricea clavata]|uniref:Uncharacterized protein n=1 Tax=Paramuricea clavata TaxID=317549 RepID=A0A6S7I3H0_PARCT|nr:Hypothetical predicted protein [Paramuricea clavata]
MQAMLSKKTVDVSSRKYGDWKDTLENLVRNLSVQNVGKLPSIQVTLCYQLMPFMFHEIKIFVSSALIVSAWNRSASAIYQNFQI